MPNYDHKTTYPNLLILGSQKSGTTSLFNYLSNHPDIFGSNPIKEPGFFSKISIKKNYFSKRGIVFENKNQLLNRFMLRGYENEEYILDASTDYTIGNLVKKLEVIENLSSYDKASFKFLYIVRNPIDRIVSSFFHIYNSKIKENSSDNIYELFELFMESNQWEQSFLTTLYYKQINNYLESFEKEQFHILTLDRLKSRPQECLNDIFNFLEIDTIDYSQANLQPSNEAKISNEYKIIIKDRLLRHPKFESNKKVLYQDIRSLSRIVDVDTSWYDPVK